MVKEQYQKIKYETLKAYWGYASFRDLQEEIIDSLVAGKDTLGLLPTGGGKSLCYQLPALFLEGTALIISPLLALMRDQVQKLKSQGIEAEYLSHELEDHEIDQILFRCKEGITSMLFISPERLQSAQFLQDLPEIQISFLAIDEAHCVSQWGQDFRPSYRNIKPFREQFLSVPCLALTATATPRVLSEIKETLGLKNPEVFRQSFKRDNLSLVFEETNQKYERVLELLRTHPHSGLIYVRSRNESQRLSEFLKSRGITRVDYYHAGLKGSEKRKKQNQWLQSTSQVLISTNAFGMGIDKPDVRLVVHFNVPSTIENYYQEIGRAGRDNRPSLAVLLYNEKEINDFDSLLSSQFLSKEEYQRIHSTLFSLFQIAEGDYSDRTFPFSLERLSRLSGCSPIKVKNLIYFLHQHELLFFGDYTAPSTLKIFVAPEELDLLPPSQAEFMELLFRNLPGLYRERVFFSEENLSKKTGIPPQELKEKLQTFTNSELAWYIDGSAPSIRFLRNRDSRFLDATLYPLYYSLQKNKFQKWEEMKYFLKEASHCKMNMLLRYFGENPTGDCHNCSNCKRLDNKNLETSVADELLECLKESPKTLTELSSEMGYYSKEDLQIALIELLDEGRIQMKDFRTYRPA